MPPALIIAAGWLAGIVILLLLLGAARRRTTLVSTGAGDSLRLGGRRFVVCEFTTVAQDTALAQHLAAAGIDPFRPVAPEETEDAAVRMFTAIHKAGVMLPILGCVMLPEELAGHARRGAWRRLLEHLGFVEAGPSGWTPAVAAETARYLGELDDPGEKRLLYAVFAQAVVPFFVAGIASSRRSPASSRPPNGPTRGPGPLVISAPGEA